MQNASRVLDSTVVAIVRRVYPLAGRPVVACWDPLTGEAWDEVPLLAPGGGSGDAKKGSSVYFPPATTAAGMGVEDPSKTKAAQVVLAFTGLRRHPYAIGFLYPEYGRVRRRSRRSRSARKKGGFGGNVGTADLEVANGGSRIVITQYGWVIIDLEGATENHNFNIQLSSEKHNATSAADANDVDLDGKFKGLLRISRSDYPTAGEQDASERLLLADQWFRYWLHGVQQWMADVKTWQNAVHSWASTLTTTVAAPGGAGTGTPLLPFTSPPPAPSFIGHSEDSDDLLLGGATPSPWSTAAISAAGATTFADSGAKSTTDFKASTVMISKSPQSDED